jgi:UDP-N-acetylglucosamine 4,6-dehydratase
MTSYLITGGTGSFGRAFVRRLLETNASDRICIYSRGEHTQAAMRTEFKDDSRLRWFIGDVRDQARLRRAFNGVDVVVHAAALKRIEVGHSNPIEMIKTNIDGAVNVIEASQDAGVKKVVALSTDKAFAPVSPYGASKALAESLFLAANNTVGPEGPLYSVTRYGNVWNSNGSVVPVWRSLIANGARSVPCTSADCTRFFMTLDESVDLVLTTIKTMRGGELNVPDLPAYRLGDLAAAMGVAVDIKGLPAWEKIHENMDDGRCSAHARRMTVGELRSRLAEIGFQPLLEAA